MSGPLETYKAFDIVVVPFPFVDSTEIKRRPAVVLSNAELFNSKAASSVLAMITSSTKHPWPLDYAISDWKGAGLPLASSIRMKLFTLDHRLIFRKLGTLSASDQKEVQKILRKLFSLM
jgi:mRNA interferase MazF